MPAATPVTVPEVEPIVATPVVPLVHVPPLTVDVNVVVWPAHTLVAPVSVADGLTVIDAVALQPVPNV